MFSSKRHNMQVSALGGARIISIVAVVFIALACGTNYAYSTWGPQFAERMKLSSTESNLIGSFGNLGMYIPAIPVGILVDSKGPRPGIASGAVLLGAGYLGIYFAFKSGPGSFPVASLCLFSFLTGCGSCAAFLAALKTAAINYPESRGTATGLSLAGYGLSAFMFSAISTFAFPGDTSMFLLMLAIVTFAVNLVALFFVRLLPPTFTALHMQTPHIQSASQVLRRAKTQDCQNPVPAAEEEPTRQLATRNSSEEPSTQGMYEAAAEGMNADTNETSSLLSKSSASGLEESVFGRKAFEDCQPMRVDIRGLALLKEAQFWQLFTMFGVLSGIGLMNINNIGNDVQALWRQQDDSTSGAVLAKYQSMHVSILSVTSCAGRLLSGAGSDLMVKKLHMNRMWCFFVSALTFTAAQFSALQIRNPHHLVFVSGLTGLAYGILYGFVPSLLARKFGAMGMSQNWGTIILAPVISGNLLNILYGKMYDKHSVMLPDGKHECLEGRSCYWAASFVTLLAGLMVGVLSLGSIWREHMLWQQANGTQQTNHDRETCRHRS